LQFPPAQNAFVAKSAMKASVDLVVSREVIASTCTTATEAITTIVVQALNSMDRDLTWMSAAKFKANQRGAWSRAKWPGAFLLMSYGIEEQTRD
jgi:hypothetical protein